MDYLDSNAQRLLFGLSSPDKCGVGAWNTTRSRRLLGIAPCRMACSCSTTNVSRHHADTAVSQLIADFHSGILIKVLVELAATATVDRCGMMGDLFIAFACIGRAQLVETFETVLMEDVPCRTDDFPLEIEVAFVRCKQVVATVGRDMMGECQCTADVIVHRDPARCRRTCAATFGAILDVDLAVVFGLTF